MKDPYLYDNCNVLRNKLNIKDSAELDAAERDLTSIALTTVGDIKGNFDYDHYKRIHEHIFGNVYDWAGKERSIPIAKAEKVLDGMSVEYTVPRDIKKEATACINKLNATDWKTLDINERADRYAENIAALWKTHPFREGNTRTAITFACEYANAHGFSMNKQIFAKNSAYTRNALVMASLGEYADTSYLSRIFKDSMTLSEEKSIQPKKQNPKTKINRYDSSYTGINVSEPISGSDYEKS